MSEELAFHLEDFIAQVLQLVGVESQGVRAMSARTVAKDAIQAHFDGLYVGLHLMTVVLEGANALKFHVLDEEVCVPLQEHDVYYVGRHIAHTWPHSNVSRDGRKALVIGFAFCGEKCPSHEAFLAEKSATLYHWSHVQLAGGLKGLKNTAPVLIPK
jgi:hypothetical protein